MLLGSQCQGKVGMLKSMGSQRCGYGLVTEQLQQQGGIGDHSYFLFHLFVLVVLGLCCCTGACLVAVSGAAPRREWGFSLCWPLLLPSTGLGAGALVLPAQGLGHCGPQALELQSFQHRGSGAVAHGPWSFSPSSTGARALWPTGPGASVLLAQGLGRCGSQALERGLSRCGTGASLLRGMWNLPGPGIEPMSPAVAGEFLSTVPPGKSPGFFKGGWLRR